MKEEALKQLEAYRALRKEIDEVSEKLEKLHEKHMSCKKGCSKCCMNFNILPIEYYTMKEELTHALSEDIQALSDDAGECAFLRDDLCSIYSSRPIICRTHGLPLLFMNESGDAWELSCCPMNFTDFELEGFHEGNTYAQDLYNSKLFLLNKEFIQHLQGEQFGEFDLIPMSRLVADIKQK